MNLLHGQPVADRLQTQVTNDVSIWKSRGILPKITTLLVDGDAASSFYARAKKRHASKLGIDFELITFPKDVAESFVAHTIAELNVDPNVHGIMLELPLPRHICTESVIETISPMKDVDGLTRFNRHANVSGSPGIYPATPLACVKLLSHYGYELPGKHVVLVGCGKTVGMPLFHVLVRENATVTACHAGTVNLGYHIAQADIVFVAVGCAGLITPDMVHPGLVIIDAGINETSDDKIVGDVAPEVALHVEAMSPTPGGVGPVTTTQLFANLMEAMKLQFNTVDPNQQPQGQQVVSPAATR